MNVHFINVVSSGKEKETGAVNVKENYKNSNITQANLFFSKPKPKIFHCDRMEVSERERRPMLFVVVCARVAVWALCDVQCYTDFRFHAFANKRARVRSRTQQESVFGFARVIVCSSRSIWFFERGTVCTRAKRSCPKNIKTPFSYPINNKNWNNLQAFETACPMKALAAIDRRCLNVHMKIRMKKNGKTHSECDIVERESIF